MSQDRNQLSLQLTVNQYLVEYLHFDSFIARCPKFGLISNLIFRSNSVCSILELYHEIINLKEIFGKNAYEDKFFDKCLQTFLNKTYFIKVSQDAFPKKLYSPLLFTEIIIFNYINSSNIYM